MKKASFDLSRFQKVRKAFWHYRNRGTNGLRLFEQVEGRVLPRKISTRLYTESLDENKLRSCRVAILGTRAELLKLDRQWHQTELFESSTNQSFDLIFISKTFSERLIKDSDLHEQVIDKLAEEQFREVPLIVDGTSELELANCRYIDLGEEGLGVQNWLQDQRKRSVVELQHFDATKILDSIEEENVVITSATVPQNFADCVVDAEDVVARSTWVSSYRDSEQLRNEQIYRAQMRAQERFPVWERVNLVLDAAGLKKEFFWAPIVSVLASTNRPQNLNHLLKTLAKQRGVILDAQILTHGFKPTSEDKENAEKLGLSVRWTTAPQEQSLGENYNQLISSSKGNFVSKIDDDDEYGAYFLLEQVSTLLASGAALVGKRTHPVVVSLAGDERQVLRHPGSEKKWVRLVSGATMTMKTETATTFGFSAKTGGEDTDLQRRILDKGLSIWSSSQFGYVQSRMELDHSWQVNDHEFFMGSKLVPDYKVSGLLD